MKNFGLFLFFLLGLLGNLFAQSDSLINFKFDSTLSLSFPNQHTNESGDFRQIMEGRNNGIIYNLFVTDEYAYTKINNNLQLDSLYEIILFNTLQIYSGEVIESTNYNYNFAKLRGKYLLVQATNSSNPFVGEYYLVCVKGRLYLMSITYLRNYSTEQIQQAKNFINTVHFDEKLDWESQMNRF